MDQAPTTRPTHRTRNIIAALMFLVAAGVTGVIVYLRYFYGSDAPPPFELSSGVISIPFFTRRSDHR